MRMPSFILALSCIASMFALASVPESANARSARLNQYVSPRECVRETVNDGVETRSILTPEECEELLNPEPIDENPTPMEPQEPRPIVVDTSDRSELQAPNTGFMRYLSDGVVKNRDLLAIVATAAAVALFLIVVRKFSRQHKK